MQDERPIPLVDLSAQHAPIADELEAAISEVISTNGFILGPAVASFERAYADWARVDHAIGVANGTDAIELMLRALGIGPGDHVLVPAMTYVATASAVRRAGARPVLVDVDEDTVLIDPSRIAAARTPSTRAVIAVDLYGQMADLEAVAEAAPDLLLIEDAAQSHGARRNGAVPGSYGSGASVSFYPGKNLGALGDGGAVITDDGALADAVRALRNHGGVAKYQHDVLGMNSRLDSIQAAALEIKLRHLDGWNQLRREAAARYDRLLASVEGVITPVVMSGNEPVWHLYVVRVPDRDRVLSQLAEDGIGAGIHYPDPIHLLPAFSDLGHGRGDFPVAERVAQGILSLPLYPGITPEQQERVVERLSAAVGRPRSATDHLETVAAPS